MFDISGNTAGLVDAFIQSVLYFLAQVESSAISGSTAMIYLEGLINDLCKYSKICMIQGGAQIAEGAEENEGWVASGPFATIIANLGELRQGLGAITMTSGVVACETIWLIREAIEIIESNLS